MADSHPTTERPRHSSARNRRRGAGHATSPKNRVPRFDTKPVAAKLNPELPVSQQAEKIIAAVKNHQVVIVAGETGSGKTTQLPKIMLQLGRGRIAHTQPRRIAARAVAERIAEELEEPLGDTVGYQVRFTDKTSANTRIKLMTDGILLNALHHDRLLSAYDTIIIDEAHERSLNIDFLMGYLKMLLPQRPDMKVIITSATIDPESFADFFNGAPIVTVTGRSYPVEIRYRPLTQDNYSEQAGGAEAAPAHEQGANAGAAPVEKDIYDGICDAATELLRDCDGHILVFLAGEGEIKDAADALHGRLQKVRAKTEVLQLYGRLSAADQHRIFSPAAASIRRIILATNIAETSITVPGIAGVIDAGKARISRYSSARKIQRLPIENISQASAVQRAGRAGRISAGVAIRLYSETDFNSRPEYTDPEISRTNLAAVLLQLLSLGFSQPEKFPFLTPLNKKGVRDGLTLLAELGAVSQGRITPIGKQLAKIPLEPRFARMVLEGMRHGASSQIIAIVAGLTVADVREYPEDQREHAASMHARFRDPLGDVHTLLNLYNQLREWQDELSGSAFRKKLKAEYLSVVRVREWFDLTWQIGSVIKQIKLSGKLAKPRQNAPTEPKDLVHFCVLAGLLSQLGVRDDNAAARSGSKYPQRQRSRNYLGSRGTQFVLHPGSVLSKSPPETIMAVELVETSRLFARTAAQITPEWAETLAGSLTKISYSSPRWSRSAGAALVSEKVILFGMPIVADRIAPLKKYDPAAARRLFIESALVQGEWREDHPFERHNRGLRNQLEKLAETTRTRGLVGDDDDVYEFFEKRIPQTVTDAASFNAWWLKTQTQKPKLLHLTKADLLKEDAERVDLDASEFPKVWSFGEYKLGLKYRFSPGSADDGVTVTVPLALLAQLENSYFQGLVPGLRHELIAALIKTLPKEIRKHVVPANDWAHRLHREIEPQLSEADPAAQTQLPELLAKAIRKLAGIPASAGDFDQSRLPAHLQPKYRVVDERGRTLSNGSDLTALKKQHSGRVTQQLTKTTSRALPRYAQQKELTGWPISAADKTPIDIPRNVNASYKQPGQQASGSVRAYPCLVDAGKHVNLELASSSAAAAAQHRLGLRRLIALSTPSLASYVYSHLTPQEKLQLAHSPYMSFKDAFNETQLIIAEQVMFENTEQGLTYEHAEFQRLCDIFASALMQQSHGLVTLFANVCQLARNTQKAIDAAKSLAVLPQIKDAADQLRGLVFARSGGSGFISHAGITQLQRYPIYLQAIIYRMQQLPQNPGRDRQQLNEVIAAVSDFEKHGGKIPLPQAASPHLHKARWQLEELRVSLFAQQLGTAEKISLQRIRKHLQEHAS